MNPNGESLINSIPMLRYAVVESELERCTKRLDDCEVTGIAWDNVQYLHILGEEKSLFSTGASYRSNDNIYPGIYVNEDYSWILMYCMPRQRICSVLAECGSNLEVLDLRFTSITSLDVSNLKGLKKLWLSRNRNLEAVAGLDQLKNLRELDLRETSFLSELDLNTYTELEKLDITGTQIRKITLDRRVESLKTLWATGSRLADVCFVQNLPNIERLNLSQIPVAALPDFSQLHGLLHLRLSGLQIAAMGVTMFPAGLEWLDLKGTDITRVPECIRDMKSLKNLNLSNLRLEELPDWLPELELGFSTDEMHTGIILRQTAVEGVDMSIFEQSQEMILKWFEEQKKGNMVPLNEIKVVFLGDGGTGKSHTIARLRNYGGDPVGYVDEATPGIVINDVQYPIGDRNVKLKIWDFGGQEILHSMHQIFLTERTIYVVVVDGRAGTQDDRARYWLNNIRSFAPEAPVILVLNKLDNDLPADINERDLRKRFAKLKRVVGLSAAYYPQEKFYRNFISVLLDEIQKTGYLDVSWPVSWTMVKQDLEKMQTHYIRGGEYRRICEKYGVDTEQEPLLNWFNDLGVSFSCRGENDYELVDYVILKPDWITNALYIMLFNKCEGANNGLLPHKSIHKLLRSASRDPSIRCVDRKMKYEEAADIQYAMGVIRKFRLSFAGQNAKEFIPMLCGANASKVAHEYEDDEKTLEFRMEFDYLPNTVLHRLMVERQYELDMSNVWRTGARFKQEETGLSAVCVIESNTLRIFVRQTDDMHRPNTYLTMLKGSVDRIWRELGLNKPACYVVYKLEGQQEVFDYDMLKAMQGIKQSHAFSRVWNKMLPIMDILNQAAPEGMEGEKKLLENILKSCLHIQGTRIYHGSSEDERNTRLRDDLRLLGYDVHDQTRQGRSESGDSAGELDLEIRTEDGQPWAIVEALRIKNGVKRNWDKHLNKLLDNYNAHGVSLLFLVTYVDREEGAFRMIWDDYEKNHIPVHDAERFSYVKESITSIFKPGDPKNHLIRGAKCQYINGGDLYTVYHIFVQVEPAD